MKNDSTSDINVMPWWMAVIIAFGSLGTILVVIIIMAF